MAGDSIGLYDRRQLQITQMSVARGCIPHILPASCLVQDEPFQTKPRMLRKSSGFYV